MSEIDGKRETYVSRLAVHNATTATAGSPSRCSSPRSRPAGSTGPSSSCLSTDSRTGALSLYEKVGMVTDSVWVNSAIDLT